MEINKPMRQEKSLMKQVVPDCKRMRRLLIVVRFVSGISSQNFLEATMKTRYSHRVEGTKELFSLFTIKPNKDNSLIVSLAFKLHSSADGAMQRMSSR